jgi:hypothetical protein
VTLSLRFPRRWLLFACRSLKMRGGADTSEGEEPSMRNQAKTLAERVNGELPAGIAALSQRDQQALADALGDALGQQARELAAAAEGALAYVPKLLRGPVRKAVGL